MPDPSDAYSALTSPKFLSECDLFYVQVDERQTSLTLGFEVSDFDIPEGGIGFEVLRKFRSDEGHNAMRFFISFTDVLNFSVNGWENPGQKHIQMVEERGHFSVSAESPGSSLRFEASSFSIPHIHSYLAGQSF
ncbi:Imm50 family immunity protein [Streptomyces sp. NPDC004111]|uniref:Imm50 family immunity protein n=1 Tax=Streptomyces sp. NPDC004111 TaxID=3364690 RepID=UPI00367C4FB6